MSSAKASPAEGPPTPPASILILHRQRDLQVVASRDADERPLRVLRVGDGLDRRRHPLAVTDERDPHHVAGPVLGEHRAQVGDGA